MRVRVAEEREILDDEQSGLCHRKVLDPFYEQHSLRFPGARWTLDRGLSKLGRAFEKQVFLEAHQLVLGSNATAKRLKLRRARYDQAMYPSDRKKAFKKIIKDCYLLLKYTEMCLFSSQF